MLEIYKCIYKYTYIIYIYLYIYKYIYKYTHIIYIYTYF